jgi:hypothetical protein
MNDLASTATASLAATTTPRARPLASSKLLRRRSLKAQGRRSFLTAAMTRSLKLYRLYHCTKGAERGKEIGHCRASTKTLQMS